MAQKIDSWNFLDPSPRYSVWQAFVIGFTWGVVIIAPLIAVLWFAVGN